MPDLYPRRRVTLLVNPAARGVTKRVDPGRIVTYLERRACDVHLRIPSSPRAFVADARRSADRADDLLFVVGGDGSVRDAAEGLAGSATALAAVPAGTVNIWAREAGLPGGLRGALDAHLGGQVASVDLGRANGRPFLLMAGVGWDAAIARRVSKRLKRFVGDAAYLAQGLAMLPGLRTRFARWEADGAAREASLALLVVSNTSLYGGRVRFSPGAVVDDGLLDVTALCPASPLEVATMSYRLLRTDLAGHRRVYTDRVRELFVETPGLPVQLDGDYAFASPVQFRIERAALRVSLPAGPLPHIFGRR